MGAGFTGTELVAELAEYVPILCEKYEIDRGEVKVINIDALSRVVPILPEKLSKKIEKRLHKMNVSVMLNQTVTSIGEDYIETDCGGALIQIPTGTIVWVAGIEASNVTAKAADTLPSFGRGRIETDAYLRSVADKSVYVVGDNIGYIVPGEKNPVPQMVENCEQSAHTAAHNIAVSITGKGELEEYKPSFHGVMVSVGGRYGVARVGTAKRMIHLPSFFAMFVKHFINIVYFIQVLGWNKVFSYLKHEFFTIRNKRSFVGGHLSNRTPSFLLVPLRLWLGAVWVFEGVKKIIEGWFSSPQLVGFFKGASSWYDSIINGVADGSSGASSVSDAASSASGVIAEAGEKIGEVLFNFDFLGLFRIIFVSGKELAESTISDFAFKLDIPLMNWFVDNVITANGTIQIVMQVFIVLAEILIGLALIGGLFTTPASAFSLVLQVMFVCTTGLYLNTFWMIFAAVAVLIGSGGIFGLDYYVMPALKKAWKKLPFVRRLYIYND